MGEREGGTTFNIAGEGLDLVEKRLSMILVGAATCVTRGGGEHRGEEIYELNKIS